MANNQSNFASFLEMDLGILIAKKWNNWSIFTGGIDFDLPGNGGPECLKYLTWKQRILETLLGLGLTLLAYWLGHSGPKLVPKKGGQHWQMSKWRLAFLASLAICFGMELTYKLATKQLIFILNPCHMLCLLQLWILGLNPHTKLAQNLFKIMLNALYAPLSACIFPVTNTLFLPGEIFTFWLEHILLLAIPVFLIFEGILLPEGLNDPNYALQFYAYYYIYNLLIVQPIAILTLANVNNLLCPAITDPFAGKYYRLHTLWHQLCLSFTGGKLFALIGKASNYWHHLKIE